MSGLERVDRPSRWPWVGLGLVVVVAIGLAGWQYFKRCRSHDSQVVSGAADALEQDASPVLVGVALFTNSNENAPTGTVVVSHEGVNLPVVSVSPPSVEGAVLAAQASATALVAEANVLLAADKKDIAREK